MHAVIPVAGIGTRLRPFTHTLPKVLVNVAGKPILGHILDALIEQDVTSATIITGYKGELVEEFVRSSYNLDVTFVEQSEMLGLGHAIWTARESLNEERHASDGVRFLAESRVKERILFQVSVDGSDDVVRLQDREAVAVTFNNWDLIADFLDG